MPPAARTPTVRPGAEGGSPLCLEKEAVPGGRGDWGRAGPDRADRRELAATGCCPSAERAPRGSGAGAAAGLAAGTLGRFGTSDAASGGVRQQGYEGASVARRLARG